MKLSPPSAAPGKITIRKIPLIPFLIILPALFPGLPAVAQTPGAAPPLSQAEKPPGETPAQGDPESQAALERFDRVHFNNQSATHYSYTGSSPASSFAPWFFPPTPPALDGELPLLPPLTSGVPAPVELAEFTSDWFYPLLASRLITNDLPKPTLEQLQAYRAAKRELQNELRSQLATLKEASPQRREQTLATFAAQQTSRIVELENLAEKIRADLRRNDLLGSPAGSDDWTSAAAPRLQKAHDTANEWLEAEVFRAAAFYQDGLSTAQRRLLLAATIELETRASPNSATISSSREAWVLPFSPEPARILLVANLPAPFAKKISDYTAAKQGLQAELRDTLLATLSNNPGARTKVMKELAGAQAPRIAALEVTAEEIRRDLAALPNPPGPPASPSLPPELTARIAAYRTHKLEVLKTLYVLLAKNEKPIDPATGPKTWMRDGATQLEVPPAKSRASALEFNTVQTQLLAELNREQAGIREALAEHFRATNQPTDRKSINDLLKDFETARQKQEIWGKYRDYQNAVLLPGLSPEQRRLLFDAAVEKLSLPLPAGERVP